MQKRPIQTRLRVRLWTETVVEGRAEHVRSARILQTSTVPLLPGRHLRRCPGIRPCFRSWYAQAAFTGMATTSRPRSLLSIARLNIARSRVRPSIRSFADRPDVFWCNGSFGPVSLPLFQGTRFGGVGDDQFILRIHPPPPPLQTQRRMGPAKVLESGRLSDHSGPGSRRRRKRPVAFDPKRTSQMHPLEHLVGAGESAVDRTSQCLRLCAPRREHASAYSRLKGSRPIAVP